MSTTDNNKLLAEFMGFQQTNIGWYDAEEVLLRTEIDNTFDSLKFHTDWNWLMQVVEKIESLDTYYNKYIDYNSSMFTSGKIELSTNIDNVYNACIDFVKWYNTQEL